MLQIEGVSGLRHPLPVASALRSRPRGWREDGLFRQFGEALRENTVIGKFRFVISTANLEQPAAWGGLNPHASNFHDRDDYQRVKVSVERPDVFGGNEEPDGGYGRVAGLIVSAAYNGLCSEFARFAVGARFGFGGRQQDGDHK